MPTDAYNGLAADTPDKTLTGGQWELRIYYHARGSRSEGQHGVLLHQGEVVEPQQVGEVLETDLGKLKYYRRPEDRRLPSELTGWNFAEHRQARLSWDDN